MQRLSSLDAEFVYGESSGWPLHVGSLTLFDTRNGLVDVEDVREVFRRRLPRLNAFRHRLLRVPGGLDRPVWVEERHVDIDEHVHACRVPSPGTDRQLGELVGDLFAPPLDLTRPPWEKWVIEGVAGHRIAVLDRVHHSLLDGLRAMDVVAATYDLQPAVTPDEAGAASGAGSWAPRPPELIGDALVRLATTPVRAVGALASVGRGTGRAGMALRSGKLAGLALPFRAPRTSFNGLISARRDLAFTSLSLAPVKVAAHSEGVTVNDVVLSLIGGMLRRYLEQRGELPDRTLTACMPVGFPSFAAPPPVGGNRLSVTLASLGTDVADPRKRIRRVARSARAGKAVVQAFSPDAVPQLLGLLPPALTTVGARVYGGLDLARWHPPVVNLVVSSVRGSPVPLYLAGARMLSSYPIGPITDGLGINVTVISYLDSLDIGIATCPDLVEDPWQLVIAVQAEAAVLAGSYGQSRRRSPSATGRAQRRPAPARRTAASATVGGGHR